MAEIDSFLFYLSSGEAVSIEHQVSRRTSRLRLKWVPARHLFSLTYPPMVSETEILTFLRYNEGWIKKNIRETSPKTIFNMGDSFLFFGQRYNIIQDLLRKKGIWKDGHSIIVGNNLMDAPQSMEQYLKKEALSFFEEWSHHYARVLETKFSRVSIRDGHSRWGSCSSSGTLSYSWRLGLAPLEVAKYVCAHEVAHLKEMNHSPRFWALVAQLDPDYKKHRAWLKKEGHTLKMISFFK
ncbi:MAG: M48 family metallopeptidase [Alphaproteobacteria bacterium]